MGRGSCAASRCGLGVRVWDSRALVSCLTKLAVDVHVVMQWMRVSIQIPPPRIGRITVRL